MSEMDKLENYLKEHGYFYARRRRFAEETENTFLQEIKADGGEQIIVFDSEYRRKWDAICGYGSYGYRLGLLEICGDEIVDRKVDGCSAVGYLTAQDVIDRIEKIEREGV